IVRAMGAENSIQQVHDQLVIHTERSRAVWPLPEPFCTFHYREFCRQAFARTQAAFLQATVLGRVVHSPFTIHHSRYSVVRTSFGDVEGRFLIDATGWRAVLAGGPASCYVNRRWMAFGIETEIEREFEPGLHFYFLPEVRDGYAWAFPCDGGVRFGVLSYLGRSNLRAALAGFLERFGAQIGDIHGGFLASGLRSPVVDGVFVIGDAAGQCLPVTGEGIRTAVLAGFTCGDLIQQVLEGRLSLEEATAGYSRFAVRERRRFRTLLWANLGVMLLTQRLVGHTARLLSRPGSLQFFLRPYLSIFRKPPLTDAVAAC
ncbi:MAG: hypothetical protein HYY39_01460, partial [Armatimonadetes bacterium]|nr:hypothetical protein [Armatimonadota bacterium]